MQIERTFGEYFKYSLHDARVQKIEYKNNNLILHFDYIFSYTNNGEEQTHKAKIIFENTNIYDVEFMVLSSTNEKFRGQFLALEDYIEIYKDSEFEIITETYNWGRAVFQGWLRKDTKPVNCTLNIRFQGKMIYDVEDN